MKTKSAIVKKYAKKHGLKIINFKLSKCPVEDLQGLPFFNTTPTLKDWLTWAKKTKVDPGVITFVKKHGLKHARAAVRMNDLFTGLRSSAEKHFGKNLAGKVSVELKFVKGKKAGNA